MLPESNEPTIEERAEHGKVELVIHLLALTIEKTQAAAGYSDADLLSAFFTLTGEFIRHVCAYDARNVPRMEEAVMRLLANCRHGEEQVQ